MSGNKLSPFSFRVLAECSITKARAGLMSLRHCDVQMPVFMPVGTQGSLKGLLSDQLLDVCCEILLGNTYHLGMRPGISVLKKSGGLHNFMGWPRAILTDSGGFQMVSLLQLATIDDKGVNFRSPFDNSECMLTPEHSIEIQNVIGGDIIMQLDDVVKTTTTGARIEVAMQRTINWVHRCIEAHTKNNEQSMFPIVQGGLIANLREKCIKSLMKHEFRGYAIGGLSGGESKDEFWRTVHLCTELLPKNKPRYLMGVGFPVDLVICVALGVDMFDCVFPTRTARFGCALVFEGQLNLKQKKYALDLQPIDPYCDCSTCQHYSRSYLHYLVTLESVACSLLSIHNIAFQMRLMQQMQRAIKQNEFPKFVEEFMIKHFHNTVIPKWIKEALLAVNITLPQE